MTYIFFKKKESRMHSIYPFNLKYIRACVCSLLPHLLGPSLLRLLPPRGAGGVIHLLPRLACRRRCHVRRRSREHHRPRQLPPRGAHHRRHLHNRLLPVPVERRTAAGTVAPPHMLLPHDIPAQKARRRPGISSRCARQRGFHAIFTFAPGHHNVRTGPGPQDDDQEDLTPSPLWKKDTGILRRGDGEVRKWRLVLGRALDSSGRKVAVDHWYVHVGKWEALPLG